MKTHETESYRLGYENGLLGVCYTRADAEYHVVLVNTREVDLYMLGQGEGLYKRNNGWAAHL
jgi:hypothetical protein